MVVDYASACSFFWFMDLLHATAVMKKSLRSVLRARTKRVAVIAPLSACDQKYCSTV